MIRVALFLAVFLPLAMLLAWRVAWIYIRRQQRIRHIAELEAENARLDAINQPQSLDA